MIRAKTLKEHLAILKSSPGNSESVDALLEALLESEQRERYLINRINTLESERNALIIKLNQLN